jgi:hypothetical protein
MDITAGRTTDDYARHWVRHRHGAADPGCSFCLDAAARARAADDRAEAAERLAADAARRRNPHHARHITLAA